MNARKITTAVWSAILIFVFVLRAHAATGANGLVTVDYQKLVSAADIRYTGLLNKPYYGLPVGTGVMASLVWNSGNSALKLQLNRADVFAYNSAMTGVCGDAFDEADLTKLSSDFGCACAFVTVDVGGRPFTGATRHHLALYDGKLTITGEGVSVEVVAGVDADTFAIRIKDERAIPQELRIDLTTLQKAGVNQRPPFICPEVTKLGETAASLLAKGALKPHCATLASGAEGTVLWLTQKYEQEAATQFREFDHYCAAGVAIAVAGRSATVSIKSPETASLSLLPGNSEACVFIAGVTTMNKNIGVDQMLKKARDRARAAKSTGYDKLYAANQAWWREFWARSYVCLPGNDSTVSIQQKWYYYLYLTALSMRGQYPASFKGNIWSTSANNYAWGSMYWGFNEEPMLHSYDAANHGELLDATLRMDLKNYDNYKTLARQQWIGRDTEAIFIEETRAFNGPERVPEEIAKDLLACTTPEGPGPVSRQLELFRLVRHYHESRWQLPFGYTGLKTSNASAKAEHYWERYLYTLDRGFLLEAYKMIKGAAEFYRNSPHLKLEADGRYHHYKSNIHEHIYGAKDTVEDLAFIRGVMTAAGKAAAVLGVDEALRTQWRNIAAKVAPYPLSSAPEAAGVLDRKPNKPTWAQARRPLILGPSDGVHGAESPRLRMLESFDVLTLETVEQARELLQTHPDDTKALQALADWKLANNTFEEHPGYRLNMEGRDWKGNGADNTYGYEGGSYILDAAALGRPEFNAILASENRSLDLQLAQSANRFRHAYSYDQMQGFGMLSAGLQKGLLQSVAADAGADPVIRVFPAWDLSKPASFRLLAKGGFLVAAAARNGAVSYVQIDSRLGGTCRIRNPWPGAQPALYRNGAEAADYTVTGQTLLAFSTAKGENIVLVKRGDSPANMRVHLP